MQKIKVPKDKFKMLRDDFPDYATLDEIEKEIERLEVLGKYYNNKQLSEKTIINSSYGALASQYFVGFNLDVAASVTAMGREIVKFGAKILNKYFFEYWHNDTKLHEQLGLRKKPNNIEKDVLRYGDTDSNYISLEDLIDDLIKNDNLPEQYIGNEIDLILDIYNNRLIDYINSAYDQFAKKYNTINIQKFELEDILYNVIFLAKKKYVGEKAWSDSGGKIKRGEKLKMTGVEIVQSSAPNFCRKILKELLSYIFKHIDDLNMAEFIKILSSHKKNFKIQKIENISISKTVGNYDKFIMEDKNNFVIKKGCPIHIRGAAYHNYLVQNDKEANNKYKIIKSKDKIKMYYSSDVECNVFSFLPGVHPYEIAPSMDYDVQFEKTVISPVNRLIEPLGLSPILPNLICTKSLF